MRIARSFMLLVLAFVVVPVAADPLRVQDMVKRDDFEIARLSPGGEYLGLSVPLADSTALVVIDLRTMERIGSANHGKNAHVLGFEWVAPDRIVYCVGERFGDLRAPQSTGELFAMNADGKNLPLVLYPHGGPIGEYDDWRFDPVVQLLASHGYAVLQVNYRGSGGYGRAFEQAGFREWGGKMQDDLTDATRWAIAQGIADPSRICIYGASYGGYAALMGAAKEPELYRCAAGHVGVYDLRMIQSNPDAGVSVRTHFKAVLGNDNRDALSPALLADRIRVSVMLTAGREDVTAPPEHTERMRDALVKAGKDVDAKIYPGEGHGFFVEANRVDMYSRLFAFLDRHIGTPAQASAAAN